MGDALPCPPSSLFFCCLFLLEMAAKAAVGPCTRTLGAPHPPQRPGSSAAGAGVAVAPAVCQDVGYLLAWEPVLCPSFATLFRMHLCGVATDQRVLAVEPSQSHGWMPVGNPRAPRMWNSHRMGAPIRVPVYAPAGRS